MDNYTEKENLIAWLGKVSLFQHAGKKVLLHLAEKTIVREHAPCDMIIRKGDVGQSMYIILSGDLKVHDGEHEVARLSTGNFFGELSLLDSEPRSMSVSTLNATVLGSIDRDDFYEVLREFPEMTKDIIAELNTRLRNQNNVIIGQFKNREEQLKELVKIRTSELEQKNVELEAAMVELKRSQQQLIQSEKLASLGKLTAGIAHEIQNPLNFVNNFSYLSGGLLDEVLEAKTDEERKEIVADLRTNMEKINQHGKRADSIVKSMLEHSRSGTGKKMEADINQLCDEFSNIAWYGMQSKHADFKCEIKKHFADGLPKVQLIPQEISKVVLNVLNNAFYTTWEKSRKNGSKDFIPEVSISTTQQDGHINILVKDNGEGIASSIKEKIFQPFFTTKPTGEGTGLGLSLSDDIVKAHGGRIDVESREGEGAAFSILLPI